AVIVEMTEVAAQAKAAGETVVQGRALSALAEAVLQHKADPISARRLATEALEVLEGQSPGVLFEPLSILSQVAGWLGDGAEYERRAKAALEAARAAERKDLEVIVIQSLAFVYIGRLEIDEARPLIDRAFELADESGSIMGRASA